ncbi:MAG: hypothetical protein VYE18_00080 [Pseudomonadota bacterium]|nr:hypothetical protein [Pseudomonadota bacterium]
MTDDLIAFDSTSPDGRALGGLEKAFARLTARACWVIAINQCSDEIRVDRVDWLPWSAPRPSDTEVFIAFCKSSLLVEVEDDGNRCLWLWGGPKPFDASEAGYLVWRLNPMLLFACAAHWAAFKGWEELRQAVVPPDIGAVSLETEGSDIQVPGPIAAVTIHPLQGPNQMLRLWAGHTQPPRPEANLRIYSAGLCRGLNGGAVDVHLPGGRRASLFCHQRWNIRLDPGRIPGRRHAGHPACVRRPQSGHDGTHGKRAHRLLGARR